MDDGDGTPTTSDGVDTVTGDEADDSSSSVAPDDGGGTETTGTTGQPAELPAIVDRVVMPDYIDVNGLLQVEVTAEHSDGVRMQLENGDLTELTPVGPGDRPRHRRHACPARAQERRWPGVVGRRDARVGHRCDR